jgi:hypothetical protein
VVRSLGVVPGPTIEGLGVVPTPTVVDIVGELRAPTVKGARDMCAATERLTVGPFYVGS